MNLIIHFGIHQKGSTSIQNNLAKHQENQKNLAELGFFYQNIEGKASHLSFPWRLPSHKVLLRDVINEINVQITPGYISPHVRIDPLRCININSLKPPARIKIIKALRALEVKEDNGSTSFLTDRQHLKIIGNFSKSNNHVARSYFKRDKFLSGHVPDNIKPVFISDKKAYHDYIPRLLKKVAEE